MNIDKAATVDARGVVEDVVVKIVTRMWTRLQENARHRICNFAHVQLRLTLELLPIHLS